MRALATILTGTAGMAMLAAASPAAAQYYPGYGYGGGGIGAVIDSVIRGGQYGQYGYGRQGYGYGYRGNERVAVDQCARAAEARVNGQYGGYGYGAGYGGARVVQITRVERRNKGWKIRGVMDTGRGGYGGGYGGYGYGGGYGGGYGDLSFDCRVDYRGYVRDVDINRGRYGRY